MINNNKWNKETAFWFGSILIAVLALVIFLMIPLENQNQQNGRVKKIYYVDNISKAHQTIIGKFNKLYQDEIEVVTVDLPFSKFSTNERKEILARSLRSKSERIDVFSIDVIWGPRFARWSYPLNNYFNSDDLQKINNYALETCLYDSQLIAIPLYIDVGLMYYRKDLLRNFPDYELLENRLKNSMTWSEFLALGSRWQSSKPYYVFAGDSFEGLVCSLHEMLSIDELNQIFKKANVDLSTNESERGLRLLVDLINKFKYTPEEVLNFDEFKCYDFALKHDALFLRGWSGIHQQNEDRLTDLSKLNNLGMAPLPHFEGNKKSAVFGGWNLMVSKYSKNKDAAIKFIKFMHKKENQELLYELGGYIPINKEVYEDSVFLSRNSKFSFYLHLLNYGKHRPMRVDYTMISDIMSHYLNAALKEEIDVNQALYEASTKINAKQVFIK